MGTKGGGFYVCIVKSTGRRYMLRDSLIIGVQNERVALGKEIADRIQV